MPQKSLKAREVLSVRFDDRSAVKFAEDGQVSSVQLMRAGKFMSSFYGKIVIDAKLFSAMKKNFDSGARGQDIPISCDHERGEAQGWIKALTIADDALWGDIAWTEPGAERIAKGLYRYMSAEWDPDYTDPEGKDYGATLFAAALTNFPFLKGMAAVALSEGDNQEDVGMDKAICDALGLSETATAEEITAAIEALKVKSDAEKTAKEAALAERQAATVTLTQSGAQLKALSERIIVMETERKTERITRALADAKAAGKVTPAMEPHLLVFAERDFAAFAAFLSDSPVVVSFGAKGSSGDNGGNSTEAFQAAIQARLSELQKTSPTATFADAYSLVAQEQPDLARAYHENRV